MIGIAGNVLGENSDDIKGLTISKLACLITFSIYSCCI
jgi:hypothetical protein